jgi:hypothetical protein
MIRKLLLVVGLLAPVEAFAFGWHDYPVPQLAKPGVVPGGKTAATPKIWIPLPQYLHPFRGRLILKHKDWDGSSISSFAYTPKLKQCVVTITRIGSGGIGPQAWMCAFIAEIGTCNGGPDVNGTGLNADRTRMGLSDQWAYMGRLCETLDIPSLYKAVGGK